MYVSRKEDLARISQEHKVDAESNHSFGEGGAGAYSDGKLYTRSKKRGSVEKNIKCILPARSQSHHIVGQLIRISGRTTKLPRVIENMRNTILPVEEKYTSRLEWNPYS